MNGYDRVLAMIEGRPVDHLPNMPITMMFAADQIGQPLRFRDRGVGHELTEGGVPPGQENSERQSERRGSDRRVAQLRRP